MISYDYGSFGKHLKNRQIHRQIPYQSVRGPFYGFKKGFAVIQLIIASRETIESNIFNCNETWMRASFLSVELRWARLTHIRQATFLWDVGKQYRPRLDADEISRSGSSHRSFLFSMRLLVKEIKCFL